MVAQSMRIAAIGDPIADNNFHLQIGVLVEKWIGDPRIVAPNELGELGFFPMDDLPFPLLISSAYIIEKFSKGDLY